MTPIKRRGTRLVSLSIILAGVVGLELVAGPFFVPETPQESPPLEVRANFPAVPVTEKPDVSAFAEVISRPLFAQSRRPQPPDAGPSVESVPQDLNFDLVGVVLSPDGHSALLRPKGTGEMLRVVEGQTVAGWQVRSIKANQIVLGRGSANTDGEVIKLNEKREKSAFSNRAPPEKPVNSNPSSGASEATSSPEKASEAPATE